MERKRQLKDCSKSMKGCSYSQSAIASFKASKATQEKMMKNIESWCRNGECWVRIFLSWNRSKPELYGNFPRELQARARHKGIDLIIDCDFDISLLDEYHRVFGRRAPVSYVLVSVDYLRSKSCLLELSSMNEWDLDLIPVAYYTDEEFRGDPHLQGDGDAFNNRALAILGTDEHNPYLYNSLAHLCDRYIARGKVYNPLSAAAARDDDAFLSNFIHSYTNRTYESLPDYNTFCELSHLAEQLHLFMDCPDPIMYLGFLSANLSYNTFTAHSVCSPARVSGFVPYHINLLTSFEYNHMRDMPYPNLFNEGLYYVNHILESDAEDLCYNWSRNVFYKLLLGELPKKDKCLFLIENIPYYNYLKAIANVLDFVSPNSRIVFTTTNESFFSTCSTSTFDRMPLHCSDFLPTLYCRKGHVLADEELQSLKKVQERVSLPPELSQRHMERETLKVAILEEDGMSCDDSDGEEGEDTILPRKRLKV